RLRPIGSNLPLDQDVVIAGRPEEVDAVQVQTAIEEVELIHLCRIVPRSTKELVTSGAVPAVECVVCRAAAKNVKSSSSHQCQGNARAGSIEVVAARSELDRNRF